MTDAYPHIQPPHACRLNANVGGKMVFPLVLNDKTPVPMTRIDNALLVQRSTMASGGRVVSITNETFEFSTENGKATVKLTQQGTYLDGSDGPGLRRQGFTQLFTDLAKHLA